MTILDDIVKVTINVASASNSLDGQSFSNFLILTREEPITELGTGAYNYVSLADMSKNFSESSKAYKMASIALTNGSATSVTVCYVEPTYYYMDGENEVALYKKAGKYYTNTECTTEYEDEQTNIKERVSKDDINLALAAASVYDTYIVVSTEQNADWYGILVNYVNQNEKLLGINIVPDDTTVAADFISSIFSSGDDISKSSRTFVFYSTNSSNTYGAAELASKACSKAPGGETWCYKSLDKTTPDVLDKDTVQTLTATNKFNVYVAIGNTATSLGGKTLGDEWIDVIRFRDWMKNEIQTAIINLLIEYDKIPFTEEGLELIKSTINNCLDEGVAAGGIDVTDGNYNVNVPSINEVSVSDRLSRILKNVSFDAKLSGAIHLTEIKGTFTN